KSTLMKILCGILQPSEGTIRIDGTDRRFANYDEAIAAGIGIVFQEFSLIPYLNAVENMFLAREIRGPLRLLNKGAMRKRAAEIMSRLAVDVPLDVPVHRLSVAQQQFVEIAKALSKSVKLLILDEPTASLNESDSEALLNLLMEFRKQGMTSIIITHKLNEVRKVADQITVLRDGMTVKTLDCHQEEISEDVIIRNMVGRDLEDRYPPRDVPIGETILEVKNWNAYHQQHRDRQVLHDINVTVRKGEVVGIAGLMGAGRTEFAMSVFGKSYGHKISGEVRIHGKPVDVSTVRKAIDAGLAYVTEDRKHLGLVLNDNILHNTTLANLAGVSKASVIDDIKEMKVASDFRTRLRIRSSGIFQETVNLSGGNQQKVVLSKWLFSNPDVLILDEPTRGIDVGAKYEIYTIINQLAADGKGVLMISSEMPELLGNCDRIYVMNEGRIVAELPKGEASQESIMRAIMRSGEKNS
ncbi:MAG TPA: ABC transporter ATP-binding protein, partial [Agrobacterium sp.]|nr:ABC transporter ATP-binding protein [Agrobacterium sp.]